MNTKKSATKRSAGKKSPAQNSGAKKAAANKAARKKSTLTILTESLPGFTVGRAQKTSIQASGGTPPYTFALAQPNLPAGLSFDWQGTLGGTPVRSGDTTILVKVIDFIGGHLTQAFDLQINP